MDKEQEEGENEAEVKHRTAWIEAEYIVAGWWEQEPNKKLAESKTGGVKDGEETGRTARPHKAGHGSLCSGRGCPEVYAERVGTP